MSMAIVPTGFSVTAQADNMGGASLILEHDLPKCTWYFEVDESRAAVGLKLEILVDKAIEHVNRGCVI